MRRLIQLIAASAPFQLSSETELHDRAADANGAESEHQIQRLRELQQNWGCYPLIRLRPEQVIGSLFQSSSVQTIDQNSHLLFRTLRLIQGGQFVNEYGDLGENELLDRGGTIPQRLLMMNGDLATGPTKSNPVNAVGRIALFASTDTKCVETTFLCCLTRMPSTDELAFFAAELKDQTGESRRHVVEDLIWTLYNSTEFSWNH